MPKPSAAAKGDPVRGSERTEVAARVRSARAYANLTQDDFALHLNISVHSVRRMEQGERTVPMAELVAIAEACDVPRDFMLYGYADYDAERQKLAANAVIEARFRELQAQISEHQRMHRQGEQERKQLDKRLREWEEEIKRMLGTAPEEEGNPGPKLVPAPASPPATRKAGRSGQRPRRPVRATSRDAKA